MRKIDFNEIIVIGIMCITLMFLNACTYIAVETPEVKGTYVSFHPTGNEVGADLAWTGVGRARVSRSSDGAEDLVEEVGQTLNPLPTN